jgi:hypothetical protein
VTGATTAVGSSPYDVSNPSAPQKVDVFSTTFTKRAPAKDSEDKEGRGGIWMSGYGPAAVADGSIFFVTGDGTYNVSTRISGNWRIVS